jgi:hypothetical protein
MSIFLKKANESFKKNQSASYEQNNTYMNLKYAILIILYLQTVMNVHFQGTSMKGVIITT